MGWFMGRFMGWVMGRVGLVAKKSKIEKIKARFLKNEIPVFCVFKRQDFLDTVLLVAAGRIIEKGLSMPPMLEEVPQDNGDLILVVHHVLLDQPP